LEDEFSAEDMNGHWPPGVYSLSHVAIPFKDTDQWYGATNVFKGKPAFSIGAISPRGEQGLLTVPPAQFMRLRYNPFFEYVEMRTGEFCVVCSRAEAAGDNSNDPNLAEQR
jgi:hypothetical protein